MVLMALRDIKLKLVFKERKGKIIYLKLIVYYIV